MARKTLKLAHCCNRVNYFLKNDKGSADERDVLSSFIEGILHDTGNYEGYRYLYAKEYPGEAEGLGTRRHYFTSDETLAAYEAAAAKRIDTGMIITGVGV
jgi:hypothetical protein